MKKSNKIRQRCGTIGGEFFTFLHKKASFPSGCAKKLCHFVAKLNHSINYALRFTPSGKSFFVNNVIN